MRAYMQETTIWEICTRKTICVWVLEKNGRNGIHALKLSKACCGALHFGALYCVAFLKRGYGMLCFCCVVCNVFVEKVLDMVGKFPQPWEKKKISVESVCREVCNVPVLHIGHSFFLNLPLEVRK